MGSASAKPEKCPNNWIRRGRGRFQGVRSFPHSPHAAWLVENLPTPPLDKVLIQYVPNLPVKLTINGSNPFVPKQIIARIREAMESRNKTAHTKGKRLSPDSLEGILRAIRDLLWLFDYHCGHAWALNNIRPEILDALTKTRVSPTGERQS
jgi:hypothetical protein